MSPTAVETSAPSYSAHVNPQWVHLLDLLELNVHYQRCIGSELLTSNGRRILDFLSGYCVNNIGHNHPAVIAAVREELARCGPAMSSLTLPSSLANWPNVFAGWRAAVSPKFSSAVHAAKAWRLPLSFLAHTGRDGLLYAQNAFHG